MKKYILELAVFICGAVVMIFELVGSRILAPYFGNSIFVWTSLIGIILGSLSLGYYLGGKLADKKTDYKIFSLIIFCAAVFIALSALLKSLILESLTANLVNLRLMSVVASLELFALPSVFLGMVSPYAVKLKIADLKTSGATVGNLYAISTIGSIFGTFLGGFYLLSIFGSTLIIYILSLTLIMTSLLVFARNFFKTKIASLALLLILITAQLYQAKLNLNNGIVDIDTQYNRVQIYNAIEAKTGQKIKMMRINGGYDSAMYLKNDELVFDYTKYFRLINYFKSDFKKTLMIGGAGYSIPKDYLKNNPMAQMDVVELDPALTGLARKYFNLKDDPRLKIYHEDGRTYLNRSVELYDAVFIDAFTSLYSVPYQLATKQAVQNVYKSLNDNGVVIVNIISAIEGDKGKFLRAEYATYMEIFPQVYILPVAYKEDGQEIQNIILVAIKSDRRPDFKSDNQEYAEYLSHLWTKNIANDISILIDDLAPVDNYINELF